METGPTVHDTPARKIDLEKCCIYFNSITSQFLGFFHWMVFDLFYFFLLRDSENNLLVN